MIKKLELGALRADLAAIEALLAARTEEQDPVGWFQYSIRKAEIEGAIRHLDATAEKQAKVGLFFGGRPVLGAKGIRADFAGQAIDRFQDLVSKRYASLEVGPLATRGPVPWRESAQLLITDVVRGSFGFLLEENTSSSTLIDSSLKEVVAEIAELVVKVASFDDEVFDSAAEALDNRVLGALKGFFQLLDDAGATLRIVEGEKELLLDRASVEIGRQRTESMEIVERPSETLVGHLYLLPISRRFELHRQDDGTVIKGSVAVDCLSAVMKGSDELPADILGRPWNILVDIHEMRERNRPPRINYQLVKLVSPAHSS
jgi:hypothetical protein